MRDTVAGTTTIVSVPPDGGVVEPSSAYSFAADISDDGSSVVFQSYGQNLLERPFRFGGTHVYQRDLATGVTTLVDQTPSGDYPGDESGPGAVSADGRFVAFATEAIDIAEGDHSYDEDIILRDTQLGTSTLVSRNARGKSANENAMYPQISADGSTVVYTSRATNLVHGVLDTEPSVFVYDVASSRTTHVAGPTKRHPVDGPGVRPFLTDDGRAVVFYSDASNMVPGRDDNGEDDEFYWDAVTGMITRISQTTSGRDGDGRSSYPAISGDGAVVTYTSTATNLAPNLRVHQAQILAYQRA